jgi:hypothetical protein
MWCLKDQYLITTTNNSITFVLWIKCSILRKKSQDICKSVRTRNEEWLFDTGATVHVTPNKHFLFNTSICCREIKLANGRHVWAHQVGDVLLRSECSNYLYLQGVLYSPAFNKNIISAPQHMQSQDYTIFMKTNCVEMQYKDTGLKTKLNMKTDGRQDLRHGR